MNAFGLSIRQPAYFPKLIYPSVIAKRFARLLRTSIRSWQLVILSVSVYLSTIAAVAAYDIQLTIRYALSLKQYEQNPIGRWLMDLDRIGDNALPDVTLFVALKVLGTVTVLIVIVGLVRWRGRVGHPVGIGVSTFQIGLACYLTYVDTTA